MSSPATIFRQFATTGDGLLTALRVCEVMRTSGKDLDALTAELEIYPQLLVNVRVKERRPLGDPPSGKRSAGMEAEFGNTGRVVVRFSGTEPLARVMVEGPKLDRVEHFAVSIAAAIRSELGQPPRLRAGLAASRWKASALPVRAWEDKK